MVDINGIIVSSVTPFTQSHELDDSWVTEYLSHLSDGGVQGVLILDTVSEGATLSSGEMQRFVDSVSENIGNLQFVVGNGASDLTDSIAILSYGLGKGANAVLLRPPSNESNSTEEVFHSTEVDGPSTSIPQVLEVAESSGIVELRTSIPFSTVPTRAKPARLGDLQDLIPGSLLSPTPLHVIRPWFRVTRRIS